MGTVFNKEEMLVLLQDFHRLTGLRTVVFDTYGMDILSYPPELPAYCKLVRGVPEGVIGCHLCDQNACRNATRRKETVIYTCHAGLIEVITPILIDGAAVGFLLLSHIVQGADEATEWAVAKERCAPYGIDEAALHSAYDALPRTPYPTLKSASDLLALAASALYQQGLARLNPGSSEARLGQYLSDHLADLFAGQFLCQVVAQILAQPCLAAAGVQPRQTLLVQRGRRQRQQVRCRFQRRVGRAGQGIVGAVQRRFVDAVGCAALLGHGPLGRLVRALHDMA